MVISCWTPTSSLRFSKTTEAFIGDLAAGSRVTIPATVLGELYFGAFKSNRLAQNFAHQ